METYEVIESDRKIYAGKVKFNNKLLSTLNDDIIESITNEFLATIGLNLRVKVTVQDFIPINKDAYPNEFIEISPNDVNTWILAGRKEKTYRLSQLIEFKQ